MFDDHLLRSELGREEGCLNVAKVEICACQEVDLRHFALILVFRMLVKNNCYL